MAQRYGTVTPATGSGAINLSTDLPRDFRLDSVTIHFDSAPTTSEDLVVTLVSGLGSEYNTVLYAIDPSETPATDVVFIPDSSIIFDKNDQVKVEYTNTDSVTYGVRIVTKAL